MNKYFFIIAIALFYSIPSYGADMENLLDILVKKEVITSSERNDLLKEEVNKTKSKWSNLMLTGDFRVRYQNEKRKNNIERERGRFRLRLNAMANIQKNLKVFLGFSSGEGSPRSNNQTFDSSFKHSDFRINKAFVEYAPLKNTTLLVGQFGIKKAVWTTSDFLFDYDLAPQGIGLNLQKNFRNVQFFGNSSYTFLDERSSTTTDPKMTIFQAGIKTLNTPIFFKMAIGNYYFSGVKGFSPLYNSANTNSIDSFGNLNLGYNIIHPQIDIGFDLDNNAISYIGFFSEYVKNMDAFQENTGYIIGSKIGHLKIKEKNQWNFVYTYRKIEKDAFLDVFPNSDFYKGNTGVVGHKVSFKYGIMKNVSIGGAYFYSKNISSLSNTENLLQIDLNVKF